MLDRLNAEITVHLQAKHPNIVELLSYFSDEKNVYLILEYCSRGDLEHYLKEKKTLSEHESKRRNQLEQPESVSVLSSKYCQTSGRRSRLLA